MHKIIFLFSLAILSACASTQRSKFSWTDKQARLLIDPNGIPAEHYAMIKDALIKTDRFVVVDRPTDTGTVNRSESAVDPDSQKAHWKMWAAKYDVGGIIVAHVQCFNRGDELFCHQFLAVMNPDSGKEVVAVEGEGSAPIVLGYDYLVPDWAKTALKLQKQYDSKLDSTDRKVASERPETKEEK